MRVIFTSLHCTSWHLIRSNLGSRCVERSERSGSLRSLKSEAPLLNRHLQTSTSVFSRSSSSPHHQVHGTTLTQHHYVPSMPSPSGQLSPTRSLTSEEPRSLPVPPSRSPSSSPTSGNEGEDEEDDTPRMRQRTKGADTLPSSTIPNLELPEDPKNPSSYPPPFLSVKTSSVAGYGGSSQATASLSILHKMTISRPTLPTLMLGGGAGTPASILLPTAMGEVKV